MDAALNEARIEVLARKTASNEKLVQTLAEWGLQVEFHEWVKEAPRILEPRKLPDLFLIEYDRSSKAVLPLLENLKALEPEVPRFVMLFADEALSSELLKALGEFAQDYVTRPFAYELLRKKLVIGYRGVQDKKTLVEVSDILERYSQHIDQVANDRTRQLMHAERLSTLGVMSAEIAHEINTPVAYASQSLETVRAYWDDFTLEWDLKSKEQIQKEGGAIELALSKIPSALDKVDHGLSRVSRLTAGLKKFGRQSRGQWNKCNLNDSVRDALEICEGSLKHHVEISCELEPELPAILADPPQLEQVLVNLLMNASHALEDRKDGHVVIRTSSLGAAIRLIVEDNGPGIEPEIIDTIWEPFYTTKESGKGTGLGLAISRSILVNHGGTISVANGKLGGARFEITLPTAGEREIRLN